MIFIHQMINYSQRVLFVIGLLFCLVSFSACTRSTNDEEASQSNLDVESYLPTYTLEIIKTDIFFEKIEVIKDNIWILRPGELVRIWHDGEGYRDETFELGPSLGGDDMLFDGQSLWIMRDLISEPDILTGFDPSCPCIIGHYPIGGNPTSIAYGDGAIWISIHDSIEVIRVKRFDIATKSITDFIELDSFSQKIGFGDGNVWVIDTQQNMVSIYDGKNGDRLAIYDTGETPIDIAFDDDKAWIINLDEFFITQIPFTLPDNPNSLQIGCSDFPNCWLSGIKIVDQGIFIYSAVGEKLYQFDPDTEKRIMAYEVRSPADVAFEGDNIWVLNGSRSRNDLADTLTRIQP